MLLTPPDPASAPGLEPDYDCTGAKVDDAGMGPETRAMLRLVLLLCVSLFMSCADSRQRSSMAAAASDGGAEADSGSRDAGASDAETATDATAADAGVADAEVADATAADAGPDEGTFACRPDVPCPLDSICRSELAPFPDVPERVECMDMPSECADDPTCACILDAVRTEFSEPECVSFECLGDPETGLRVIVVFK